MLIKDSKDTRFYWERLSMIDPELVDILIAGIKDTRVLAKVLFPEDYTAEFSAQHDKAFELIDSDARRIAISAFRGFGKTTIIGTIVAKAILYQLARVIPYVSKSETFATIQTENIKFSLTASEDIQVLFGDIKSTEHLSGIDMFSKKGWVANDYSLIMPRGAGQQIRGLKFIHYRPDLPIFDDLEDDETIDNEEQRIKLRKWFFSSAVKCVPRTYDNWRMIYIDTIKHEDSLLVHLLNEPSWESVALPVCEEKDNQYTTLVPAFMSQKDLDEEVAMHRRLRIMDIFAREFQCKVVASEDAVFKQDDFIYYKEDDSEFVTRLKAGKLINVVIGDPSKTEKMHNAESAVVCWAVDLDANILYFRGGYGDHVVHDEFFKMLDDYIHIFNASVCGIEDTGLDDWIRHPAKNYFLTHGLGHIDLYFLSARSGRGAFAGVDGAKNKRIASLAPYYQAKRIKHNFDGSLALETQLLSFPRSQRKDVMDAAAYIIKMLNDENLYFSDHVEKRLPPMTAYKDEYADEHYCDFDYDLGNGLGYM